MTATPRPWDDVPLDVDGVLTLDQHRPSCQRGHGCLFCAGLDDDAAPSSAERGATG